MGGVAFNPTSDIPDLPGKVILVTGGNAGLGKETIRQLVKHTPKTVYMAARSQSKAETTIREIQKETPGANVQFLQLDLTSFASIAAAAKAFQLRSDRLDILLNNAGIMLTPWGVTEEGYEMQLGTNHIGHALFTKLLLPTLLRTAEDSNSDVRIINLSSIGHNLSWLSLGLVLENSKLKWTHSGIRYGITKLANLLHARALRKRYPQITCTSVHPGMIDTDLFLSTRQFLGAIPLLGVLGLAILNAFMKTVLQGAKSQLWAMTAPKNEVREAYYFNPVGKGSEGSWWVTRESEADRLWDWTEAELKKHGY